MSGTAIVQLRKQVKRIPLKRVQRNYHIIWVRVEGMLLNMLLVSQLLTCEWTRARGWYHFIIIKTVLENSLSLNCVDDNAMVLNGKGKYQNKHCISNITLKKICRLLNIFQYRDNTLDSLCGVAAIRHQSRCIYWGNLSRYMLLKCHLPKSITWLTLV